MNKTLIPLILFLFSLVNTISAQAHLEGQKFMMAEDAIMYKYPFVTSEEKGILKAGAEVTIVDHDPDNHWARVRFFQEDGSGQDYFIDLRAVDFPKGQQIIIPANIKGGRHDGKEEKVRYDAPIRFGNESEMFYYRILLCLIGAPAVAFRLFRRRLEGKEMLFVLPTLAFVALYLGYKFWHRTQGVELEDSVKFWYMFFKMIVMALVVLCAWPLFKWSGYNMLNIASKRRLSFTVRLRYGIPSLLFLLTIVFIALQAAGMFLMVGFIILIIIGLFIGNKKGPSLTEEFWDALMEQRMVRAGELLKKGANINAYMPSGLTPVMAMCRIGAYNYLEFLLENGADPNLQDKNGNTALHYMAMEGWDLFELLTRYGADHNIVNHKGQPYFHLIFENAKK